MKNTISVIITCYNEEKNIKGCLESAKWADEIVVVDDGSTDNTVSIAKKYTQNIYHHKNVGYVEPTRNYAISKAKGDWILILDADERIPDQLAEKLQKIVEEDDIIGVRIPRKNIIFNAWIQNTGWWPDYNLRFFKNDAVVWSDIIHSQPEARGNVIDLEAKENVALLHYNYNSISQFLNKLDAYTTISARERMADGQSCYWKSAIENPFQEFLSRYFARRGYRDGFHGLALSVLMGFYEFIIYLKIWEAKGFTEIKSEEVAREFEKIQKNAANELQFWNFERKIKDEKKILKKQAYRVRRKLRI